MRPSLCCHKTRRLSSALLARHVGSPGDREESSFVFLFGTLFSAYPLVPTRPPHCVRSAALGALSPAAALCSSHAMPGLVWGALGYVRRSSAGCAWGLPYVGSSWVASVAFGGVGHPLWSGAARRLRRVRHHVAGRVTVAHFRKASAPPKVYCAPLSHVVWAGGSGTPVKHACARGYRTGGWRPHWFVFWAAPECIPAPGVGGVTR